MPMDNKAAATHFVRGRLIWRPTQATVDRARITAYLGWLRREEGRVFESYEELWQWSVSDLEGFWSSIWRFFDVQASAPSTTVLGDEGMPGASWFEGATLNYAQHALRYRGAQVAVRFEREDGRRAELTRDELAGAVGAVAHELRRMGVGPGDRVAAYLPNTPEAVIAFLATASIGAVWSACSPDFGPGAVIDRFRQIEPKVLIAVDGYRYAGREHDRLSVVPEIAGALPGLERVILVPYLRDDVADLPGAVRWPDLVATPREPVFEQVRFDHPLWILYSSGTTGLPKAMVQGHGGILLEHLKSLALHLDLGPDDRFFWFTTTGWMMWNFLVSGLLVGSSIVLYDGSPAEPDMGALWRLVERAGITYLGTSAPFIHASMKAGVEPADEADLSNLRAIGSTGAPLSSDGFTWVSEHVGAHVWLGSISGGTDLCTAVVGSCPLLPVHAGEIQCRALGAKVAAYDDDGDPMVDRVGELVIEAPMPSMPVSFWADPEGRRYEASYFDRYPGVWRHGDWIEISRRGTCRIHGRSDATLNRGGVRIGTSELYRVVETIPGVDVSLVVDTGALDHDGTLYLFVTLEEGTQLDDALRATIVERLRTQLSPRHVPDRIVAAPSIPTTLNGKRLEVPVKRLLMGGALGEVASADSLADPDSLRWYAGFAERLRSRA